MFRHGGMVVREMTNFVHIMEGTMQAAAAGAEITKGDPLGLRYVWRALWSFAKEDFNPRSYALVAVFIVVGMVYNYRVDLEDGIIDAHYGQWYYGLLYVALYSFSWFGTLGILRLAEPERIKALPVRFYGLGFIGILLVCFEAGFYYHQYLTEPLFGLDIYFYRKVMSQLTSVLSIFLPMLLLYVFWLHGKMSGFYGIKAKGANVRPYVLMLLLMSVPVYFASLTEGFRQTYPTYQGYLDPAQHPDWVWLYEACYGWDFVATELVFRGFLVIALAHAGGRTAILPMVTTYCFLHFGKPLGECIGSIFGGYILGALALRTGNIWGGIFVHLGVAWLMELMAGW